MIIIETLHTTFVKMIKDMKYNKKEIYRWRSLQTFLATLDGIPKLDKENLNLIVEGLKVRIEERLSGEDRVEIDFVNLFKKYSDGENVQSKQETSDSIKSVISFSKNDFTIETACEFNQFIDIDFIDIMIGAYWVETIGSKIDKLLSDNIYANRKASIGSSSFFSPYFVQYSKYRDFAFSKVESMVDDNISGVLIQLDLKQCYYNVNIGRIESRITELIDLPSDEVVLNNYVFKIIENYSASIINNSSLDHCGSQGCLPIGFLPSDILINLYLRDLDEMINSKFKNVVRYARYVDDILIICETGYSKVDNSLERELLKEIDVKLSEIDSADFKLNYDKCNIFSFAGEIDKRYLSKFKNATALLSSDLHKLIDIGDIKSNIENAYQLNNLTRFDDTLIMNKNKLHLSSVIAGVISDITSRITPTTTRDMVDAELLIKEVKSFCTDTFFLELYDYWIPLIYIEVEYGKTSPLFETFVWREINVLLEKMEVNYSRKHDELRYFLKYYLDLINFIFEEYKDISHYLMLPNFKNENYVGELMVSEGILKSLQNTIKNNDAGEFILHYNRNIDHYVSSDWKDKVRINVERNVDDVISLDNSDFKFSTQDKVICECITIAQCHIKEGERRFKYFLQNARNIESTKQTKTLLAQDTKSNILIFPEHSVPLENIALLVQQCKKYKQIIFAGLDFLCFNKKVYNFTIAVLPIERIAPITNDINFIVNQDVILLLCPKSLPSPAEYQTFQESRCPRNIHCRNNQIDCDKSWNSFICPDNPLIGLHVKIGDYVHSILNCYEATDLATRANLMRVETDILHVIADNKDIEYYDGIGLTISRDLKIAYTATNYSKLGGSQIYIPFKESYDRTVSYHKGGDDLYVTSSVVDLDALIRSRNTNGKSNYRANPPSIFYRNNR